MAPIIKQGDHIEAGMLIARTDSDARWQFRRHSPLTGEVVAIEEKPNNGNEYQEIIIEGNAPTTARPNKHNVSNSFSSDDIVSAAREAGIVGMGGGMFPTYAKLSPNVPIDCVIINASECEPYMTCDHRVLLEHRDEVESGLELAKQAVGAKRGEIANDKHGYPFGYENFIIRNLLGREVPSGGLPKDVGVVVINVQTAQTLHHAVYGQQPLTQRVVTVDGDAVSKPGNYLIPIGTEIGYVLEQCATDLESTALLLGGGPMMGKPVDLDSPVTPGMGAILALTATQIQKANDGPCVRCGECLEACPLGLPAGLLSEQPDESVLECIECGICQYACVGSRPLLDKLREAKAQIRKAKAGSV